jgi:hypothetical protein
MNSAWDPDPLLSSGSLSGYAEWAAFYFNYRVVKFSYDVTLSNLETHPVSTVCAPTTADLGSNYSNTPQISEFPYGKMSIMSAATGMDRCRFTGTIDLPKFLGDPQFYRGDLLFQSATGTNPGNLLYMNFGAYSGINFANGIFVSARLGYLVEFFYKRTLPS